MNLFTDLGFILISYMFNFSDVSSNNFVSKRYRFFPIFVSLDSLTKILLVGMKISSFYLKHCPKICPKPQ